MTDAVIWGDLHIAPIHKKSFDAAVANAGLLYQYCAPWCNVAELVRAISQYLVNTGMEWDVAKNRFLEDVQRRYGACYWKRLAEVVEQKLEDCQKQLKKASFSEEALSLQEHLNAPYLMSAMMEAGHMRLYYRLRIFHGELSKAAHDLPSRAYVPMKKSWKFGKPRQYQ